MLSLQRHPWAQQLVHPVPVALQVQLYWSNCAIVLEQLCQSCKVLNWQADMTDLMLNTSEADGQAGQSEQHGTVGASYLLVDAVCCAIYTGQGARQLHTPQRPHI